MKNRITLSKTILYKKYKKSYNLTNLKKPQKKPQSSENP